MRRFGLERRRERAVAPPGGGRPAPTDEESLERAGAIAAAAIVRLHRAADAAEARIAYDEGGAALLALASYARKLGRADEERAALAQIAELDALYRSKPTRGS